MGNLIVQLGEDAFVEWSSIVDAPITNVMNLTTLRRYIREEYGREGLEKLPARLERCARFGTSSTCGTTLDDLLSCNRAGEGETQIKTVKEMLKLYTAKATQAGPVDHEDG